MWAIHCIFSKNKRYHNVSFPNIIQPNCFRIKLGKSNSLQTFVKKCCVMCLDSFYILLRFSTLFFCKFVLVHVTKLCCHFGQDSLKIYNHGQSWYGANKLFPITCQLGSLLQSNSQQMGQEALPSNKIT